MAASNQAQIEAAEAAISLIIAGVGLLPTKTAFGFIAKSKSIAKLFPHYCWLRFRFALIGRIA